ncbi:MAG: oligosaccharide flippase family protein [Lachnospiraceae bacterium]|nr:oligosaccharide flippase family protein [Lachnospiraceae bacterium]
MNQKKSIKNIIMHGGILAMAGIFVRIIGLVYRIPMVNIIGAEANGIYGAAFNVYNIMLVLSSYGLPMAVSKLISGRLANHRYRDARKIFISSVTVSVCTGGTAALILYFGADFIEKHFYSAYSGIALPLRVLAPTIFIVSVLGVFRGFYQGQGTTIPTAISQLIEQIVNAVVSIAAGAFLVRAYKGSAKVDGYGAAGGTMGTAFGAFFGLTFLLILFIVYYPTFTRRVKRDIYSVDEPYKNIYKDIIFTMIPIIIGQTFYQISALIDDVLYGKLMTSAGMTSSEIKTSIGNFNSSYVILTGVVMGVASAMSASLLPSIVASKEKQEYSTIREKISATIGANMFIAMPSFVGLVVLGKPMVQLLFSRYDSDQGGMMLKIGAIAVVFYTISTVTSSALQGIDKMNIPVIHSCISLIVHIVLVFGLLKFTNLGIYAIVIGNATFPVVVLVLNLVSLNKYVGYTQEYIKTFLIPMVCSVFMGVVTALTYKIFHIISGHNIVALFFAFIMAAVSYFGTIFICKKKNLY